MSNEIDFRMVGHIMPGLVTYLIGLAWIYNTNFDYIMFKRDDANKNGRKFVTRLCFGSMCQFKKRFLKLLNISDAVIGLVLGLIGVLLFVLLTKYGFEFFFFFFNLNPRSGLCNL